MAATAITVLLLVVMICTVVDVVVSRGNNDREKQQRMAKESNPAYWHQVASDELERGLNTEYIKGKAKNVILFLGDGMGITTVTAGRILAGQLQGQGGEDFQLSFDKFPHTGMSKTYSVDHQITDSAASATAYLSGVKTHQSVLGMSAKAKKGDCESGRGNEVHSILKWFADEGRPTGIVTNTRVTHATPAASYAHSPHREWEVDGDIPEDQKACEDITSQLITKAPFINVVLGGGRVNFKPTSYTDTRPRGRPATGKRTDGKDLIQEWKDDKRRRRVTHVYATNRDELMRVPVNTQHLLGLFNPSHMDYEVDRDPSVEPSLAEMTAEAIRILQANTKGDKGFFLLVEGGRIDQGHHVGKAARALKEVVTFSEAVQQAVNLTDVQDTLMVVTADHSHVMSLGGYAGRGDSILGLAHPMAMVSYVPDKKPFTTLLYGNGPGYAEPRPDITNVDTGNKDYLQQSAVNLPKETHGGEDVPIYARGPYAHLYRGVHEQNFIPMLMAYAACVGPYGPRGNKRCGSQGNQQQP